MTLNVMAHKAHLRENNTFLKTEPEISLFIANPVPIIQTTLGTHRASLKCT